MNPVRKLSTDPEERLRFLAFLEAACEEPKARAFLRSNPAFTNELYFALEALSLESGGRLPVGFVSFLGGLFGVRLVWMLKWFDEISR